jgi:hypothetical protein
MNQERKGKAAGVLRRWTLLNERSIPERIASRSASERSGLLVRDPQVLVGEDGRVVLFDPLEVATKDEVDADQARRWKKRMDSLLEILVREARASVLARRIAELRDRRGRPLFSEDEARQLATYERGATSPAGFLDVVLQKLGRDGAARRLRAALASGELSIDFEAAGDTGPGVVRFPWSAGTSLGDLVAALKQDATRALAATTRTIGIEHVLERAGAAG